MPTPVGYLFIRACLKGLFSDPCYLTSSSMICYSCRPTLISIRILMTLNVFLHGLNPNTIQTALQSDLTLASDWFQANGITTNPSKCLSMWFGTETNDLSVSITGTVIDIANTMQLLGVSIDKDLNFNVHVKETVGKVSRKLQVLKRYKHFNPTHAKKRLYLAYFLPHLTYCSTVGFHRGKRNADIIEKQLYIPTFFSFLMT